MPHPDEVVNRLQQRLDALTVSLPGAAAYENHRPMNVDGRFGSGSAGRFLQLRYPHVAVDYWHGAMAAGHLRRRGTAVAWETVVNPGDQLVHVVPETTEPPVNAAIRVLHLDESLLVVAKPAPLPVHPCGRYNRNSLSWLLQAAAGPLGLQPRPAHRLDANTAGIMIFTLHRQAAAAVQAQFAAGTVSKLYLAAVDGSVATDSFLCEAPIGRHAVAAGGRLIEADGLPALTRFRVVDRQAGRTLLAACPVTGRTNQIRAHLWHLHLPIAGDPFYQPDHAITDQQTLAVGAPPMCLLAVRLTIHHPDTGRRIRFTAARPAWW